MVFVIHSDFGVRAGETCFCDHSLFTNVRCRFQVRVVTVEKHWRHVEGVQEPGQMGMTRWMLVMGAGGASMHENRIGWKLRLLNK